MAIRAINEDMWLMETAKTTYAIGLGEGDQIVHLYWGPKIQNADEIPLPKMPSNASFGNLLGLIDAEYSIWGGMLYDEPCLKIKYGDGCRDGVLQFLKSSIQEVPQRGKKIPELVIILKDPVYPLEVKLHYLIYEEEDIIARFTEICNTGKQSITIQQALSASWNLPTLKQNRLTYLAGQYGVETNIKQITLNTGKFVTESRRGHTSHSFNPVFMMDPGTSTTQTGLVIVGALHWTGNWKLVFEQNSRQGFRILGGINDFDFSWILEPGQTLTTPIFSAGMSFEGFSRASQIMHQYENNWILPTPFNNQIRKVLYNSWEATGFRVNEKDQIILAEKAADIGVELFCIDDGWFGQRNRDTAGLGDWYVNTEKFPNGLAPLIKKVNDLGMDFGLWVEPEMVNPDSDLFRKHPDWIFHFPNRTTTQTRHQYNLNVALPEVKEFIFNMVDDLLSKYNIKFIKWDWNKAISEPGWPQQTIDKQQEVWITFTNNLYEIFMQLRKNHPTVEFEACSGGGGRVDLGILSLMDQVWPSDNTDPFDRLFIQEGFSYFYTPKTMMAWVTDTNKSKQYPLEYRFHSSMMGSLGIGSDLNKMTAQELDIAKKMIAFNKKIRHVVQEGKMYWLESPRSGPWVIVEYVSSSQKEAVLFVFSRTTEYRHSERQIYLTGLNPTAIYAIEGWLENISGQALMSIGLQISQSGEYKSNCYYIYQK